MCEAWLLVYCVRSSDPLGSGCRRILSRTGGLHRTYILCCQRRYGPLLGGLLADKYIDAQMPQPDAAHAKQIDYLESIKAWGDWSRFQRLLLTLRRVGNAHEDEHGGAPVAVIALAYLLQLPYLIGAIVGTSTGSFASPTKPLTLTLFGRRSSLGWN